MAEYLTGLPGEEVRARAEGVAGHVAARLCELQEQRDFIATVQHDVEDPDTKIEILLRQRDIAKEISTLNTIGSILGIVE